MKNLFTKIFKNAVALFVLLMTAGATQAQVHTLQLSMQNVTNPTSTTVEFEMWIKNMTPDSISKLSFLQFGIDLPPNIGNGGTLSVSKIAANPLLPATQQAAGSPAVQLQPATPTIRVAAQTTSEPLAAAIPSTGNGIWYGTYRITNTVAFATNAVMTFTPVLNSSPSTKTRTSVAAYVNGVISGGVAFTVLGSTTVQSALRVLNIVPYPTITLNQPAGTCPTAGAAIVTDPACFGGLGSASITLSPAPLPVSGSYSVDGGTAASYSTNPFTVSGLSQGSHTVTVTNDPNCAPFNVVFTVGGPSSNPTNTTTQSACDSYTWSVNNMMYTQSGTYTATSTNTQGCTVNEILNLTITPSTSNTTVQSACDSYTWSVNNTTYTQSGTYTSVNGCHTEILNLTITPSTSNTTVQSACDSYTWSVNNTLYTQSGTYTSVNGCNTEILNLTITPSTSNTTVQSACDSYTWTVNNTTYTQSGTYTSVNGCHTEILNLTITPSTSNTTVQSACDSYTWSVNNTLYTQSGTYTSVNGCNTEILNLTITPSTSNTTVQSACGSYTWSVNNTNYTQSGTYTSVNGCNTEILDLTITPSTSNTTVQSACDTYTWSVNNTSYTQSGTYTSVNGCHTEILVLSITPSTSNTTTQSACDSYTWSVNNTLYTQSGTYTSVNGCNTEILNLTITPSTSNTTTFSGCDSYTWSVNNMMYTQSGTYTSVNGCHTEILVLTLGQSTSSTLVANDPVAYTWACNNMTYSQSGTYTCTGVNASGCPDVQTLILTIGTCTITVTTNNATGCPNAAITLTGNPAGGTFSVPNPYVGPSTTFTYSYTDPNTGCFGSASGTITVVNIASVNITSVVVTGPATATVNWSQVPGIGWYGIRYRPINSSTWSPEQTQAAPAGSKNIIGLQAGTTYEIEVRGHCSLGNAGPWGSNTVFTTAAPCGTPSGLFAAPVTGTTAKLNWTAVPGATWYQTRFKKSTSSTWGAPGTAMGLSKNIIGLSLNTQYDWQVRAICNNSAAGPWSTIDNFTTLASKESVDFATETINNNVSVYPNPVRDVLTVEVTTEVAQNTVVKVFDMSGRLVKQIQANAEIGVNNIAVNLSDVSAGVYQVQVFANDKLTHISRVNKQD
ncbi:MAG: T9SS type A sorting domain-containing protein [Chitinophagaceae bacterium]